MAMFGSARLCPLLLLFPVLCAASPGDTSPLFRTCVSTCKSTGCATLFNEENAASHGSCPLQMCGTHPDFILWGTLWSCEDDCAYHCMHAQESVRASKGFPVWKYYGKWPFRRVLGMQEVFSVLMSVANLAAHVSGALRFRQAQLQTKATNPYAPVWWVYIAASCFAWVSSAVFHSRDNKLTERTDYIAAIAVVFSGAALAAVRVTGTTKWQWQLVIGGKVLGTFLVHTWSMLTVKFDYGWNMTLCITLGVCQGVAWILWSHLRKHPARRLLTTFVLTVNLAALFEVLDFPPLFGLIDAHSLWHAFTVPLTPVWYRFMCEDHLHVISTARGKVRSHAEDPFRTPAEALGHC